MWTERGPQPALGRVSISQAKGGVKEGVTSINAAASRSSLTCPMWLTIVLGPSIVEEAAGGESKKNLEAVSVASCSKRPWCGMSSVCAQGTDF